MRNKMIKSLYSTMAVVVFATGLTSMTVLAEGYTGWKEEDGKQYWYENNVRQGYDANNGAYRGKEIYDPGTKAWYWLDNVQGGAKAVSKDVYQESLAGDWGDSIGEDGLRYGKWVRYDENGCMIKGWQETENGSYFFDYTYGTMAKGYATIEGIEYYFNPDTGVLEKVVGEVPENGWKTINGAQYWYENYVRQGYSVNDAYRGKEIYDSASSAWYWLDNVQDGAKAVNKDVYQESLAGDWGDCAGVDGEYYGKWVRYDAQGHMIKGWSTDEKGTYFFDETYGTMAKGNVTIGDKTYYFDESTGICRNEQEGDKEDENKENENKQDEIEVNDNLEWRAKECYTQNADGTYKKRTIYEYDKNNNIVKETTFCGNRAKWGMDNGYKILEGYYSDFKGEMIREDEKVYEYDENGEKIKYINTVYSMNEVTKDVYTAYKSYEYIYTYKNGECDTCVYLDYEKDGHISYKTETSYDENGNEIEKVEYREKDNELLPENTVTYKYDENGYLVEEYCDYADETYTDRVTVYVNDVEGNILTATQYSGETKMYITTYTYENGCCVLKESLYVPDNRVNYCNEMKYDENGNKIEESVYFSRYDYETEEYVLRLNSKQTYEYSKEGDKVIQNDYEYQYGTGERREIHTKYSVTTYVNIDGIKYKKEYDSYRGHYRYEEDGSTKWGYEVSGEWAYYVGYINEYNADGDVIKYYYYDRDMDYRKTLLYHTEYSEMFPDDKKEIGKTQTIKSSSTFDGEDRLMYDEFCEYEVYEKDIIK